MLIIQGVIIQFVPFQKVHMHQTCHHHQGSLPFIHWAQKLNAASPSRTTSSCQMKNSLPKKNTQSELLKI